MDWEKINIKSIMKVLRELEAEDISLDGEHAVLYSDGKEELKISYKRLNDSPKEELPTEEEAGFKPIDELFHAEAPDIHSEIKKEMEKDYG